MRPRDPLSTTFSVPKITPNDVTKRISARIAKTTPRVRAKSRPTEESRRQCGQRAKLFCSALNKNDS
jgi:hypothetical protein